MMLRTGGEVLGTNLSKVQLAADQMTFNRVNPRVFGLVALAAAALAGLCFALLSPSTAAAQAPAVCDQYPNLPECDDGGDQDDGDQDDDGVPGGRDAGGPSADAGAGGELPFTGYPLNALILLLLLLLAIGLSTKSYLSLRERMRARAARDSGR